MVMELPPHQPAATQRRGRPHFGRVLPAGNPGKVLGKRQQDLVLHPCRDVPSLGSKPSVGCCVSPKPWAPRCWHILIFASRGTVRVMGSGGQNEAGKEQPGPMGCCIS